MDPPLIVHGIENIFIRIIHTFDHLEDVLYNVDCCP